MLTNLELVKRVDSFPNPALDPKRYKQRTEALIHFVHGEDILGYVFPCVFEALHDTSLSGNWWTLEDKKISIQGDTVEERSENMMKTVKAWKEKGTFEVLKGWRDELYAVYSPNGQIYLNIERCAAALFGVVTYGVHMTAYTNTKDGMKIWVPRRSKTKSTYGGMLDNTVGGGISSGMNPWDTIIKESQEEASLPEDLVKERVKMGGVVSYFFITNEQTGGEEGLMQPEVEYVYDMELPEDVIPKPCDDEVEQFYLWDTERVKDELAVGNFKPNCAVVLIDFFIRHGLLTPENEPDYLEIVSRIHRSHEFPLARFAKFID